MTGAEFGFGVLIGVIVLFFIVSVITVVVTKANFKGINSMRNMYIRKSANNDVSIRNAMNYLKLTNGIKQQSNGDKK